MSEAKATTAREKNRRVVLNIVTGILYEVIIVAFGLILPRLYLVNFGSDVNGLDSTIKNIFAYLSLLEAGVGLSAQYALYRPVAQGNTENINAILSAARKFYLKTSVLYTSLTVLFALVYPLLIRTALPYWTVFGMVMLYGVPGIILYSLRGKYNAFMEVEGKKYILTTLSTVTLVVANVLRLVFLLISDNLLLIQATYCVPSALQVVFVILYVKKKYPWIDWKAKPNYAALSQKKSVLVHQISNCIFSNTDTIIISFMCGMNYASVYAIYSLFFANFQKIVSSFSNGLTFKFGQLFQTDRQQFFREFSCYESVFYMLLFWAYTVITAFLMPVIRLYTAGVADAAIYDNRLILLLFAVWTIMTAVEMPLLQLQSIAGKFDDTKHQAVIEMLINIVVSLIATWKLGIVGCLIGTILALSYRIVAMVIYTGREVLNRSWRKTFRKIAVNTVVAVLVLLLTGTDGCEAVSYLYVIGQAALGAMWIGALFLAANLLTDFAEYKQLFMAVKARLHRA